MTNSGFSWLAIDGLQIFVTKMNLYKVVLIGESDVGKSSTFIRFRDEKFVEHIKSTIGLDNAVKEVKFKKSESDPTEVTAKV